MQSYTDSRHLIVVLARLGLILALIAAMGILPAAPAAARPVEPSSPVPAAQAVSTLLPSPGRPVLSEAEGGGAGVEVGPRQAAYTPLDAAPINNGSYQWLSSLVKSYRSHFNKIS